MSNTHYSMLDALEAGMSAEDLRKDFETALQNAMKQHEAAKVEQEKRMKAEAAAKARKNLAAAINEYFIAIGIVPVEEVNELNEFVEDYLRELESMEPLFKTIAETTKNKAPKTKVEVKEINEAEASRVMDTFLRKIGL